MVEDKEKTPTENSESMIYKETTDLLLINPGNRMQIYQHLGSELSAIEPPIWIGLIATFMRNYGFRVAVLDTNAEGVSPEETANRVSDMKPLISAVIVYGQNPSASTMVMPAAGAICRAIKEKTPHQMIVLAGGHVAALPERTLREEAVDFVSDGEGIYTILDLLHTLKCQNNCNLNNVRGLLFRDDRGNIVRNSPAPIVRDLNKEMPSIAWDLLPMDRYRAHNWQCFDHIDRRQPYASLYTSLGCPFHCDFCCIQAPFKRGEAALGYSSKINSYRKWSPEAVVAQIDTLVRQYGVKNIKFADEIFVLSKKHVLGICDLLIERNYDLNIWAYVRVDSWTEEMLEKMKRAGINWLCLGIESGSTRVRDDVHKGYKHEALFRAVEAIQKAGIYILANYLFGLPEEDYESMEETLKLAMDLNCEFANFYCAMAYPGSNLYQRAVEKNLPLPESWAGYSQHACETLPLPSNHLPGAEVLRFRDYAFYTYFTSSTYLQMIENKFGLPVVEHIRQMTGHTLKRKYT